MYRVMVAICGTLVALTAGREADATPSAPAFYYQHDRLTVLVHNRDPAQTSTIGVVEIDRRGRAGRRQAARQKVGRGPAELSLRVRHASGHRVRLRLGGSTHRIWANHGTCFALPRQTQPSSATVPSRAPDEPGAPSRPHRRQRIPALPTVPDHPAPAKLEQRARGFGGAGHLATDLLLARGCRAILRHSPPRRRVQLTVGRTFGYSSGQGIRPAGLAGIIIVARGTVGPVTVTLSERRRGGSMRYWDYPLALTTSWRRYAIPWSAFTQRARRATRGARSPRSIYSMALRALHKSRKNDSIELDFVGLLTDRPAHIATIKRDRRGALITLRGRSLRQGQYALMLANAEESPKPRQQRVVVRRPRLRLNSKRFGWVKRTWLCTSTSEERRARGAADAKMDNSRAQTVSCDPPDAPRSSYALPARAAGPLVIDAFSALAAVNAARKPTLTFGSSVIVERGMVALRDGRSLLLSWTPARRDDYIGYLTPLPARLPSSMRTIALQIKGKVDTSAISVGLRDRREREPKVKLADYLDTLDDRWRWARIPLSAFGAVIASHRGSPRLGRPTHVSVTMHAATLDRPRELAIGALQLIAEAAPLVIARFDSDNSRTALGGRIHHDAERGARLSTDPRASGHDAERRSDRGLGVTVAVDKPDGYAYVSLGFGRLDARPFQRLCLWCRGDCGSAALYLRDTRKRRARVLLRDHAKTTADWQRLCVPLRSFVQRRRRVDLGRLLSMVFAWEDAVIAQRHLTLDDVVFER